MILCLKVKGTIYALGLLGHTYDTLSGASINTEAIEDQPNTFTVTEGDQTAKITVSFSFVSSLYFQHILASRTLTRF